MEKGIKLTGAKLKNFGKFTTFKCTFSGGVNWIKGRNGSGKTTLSLTGIWQTIKGIAESCGNGQFPGTRFKFIGPASISADREYSFSDERSGREYTIKNHITDATNAIVVKPHDDGPIEPEWMPNFFNVSLMSEKYFCGLSGKDQAIALGIDTKVFDENIVKYKKEFTELNAVYRAFGEIAPVQECKPVDADALKTKKETIRKELNDQYLENKKQNSELRIDYDTGKELNNLNKSNWLKEQEAKEEQYSSAHDLLDSLYAHGYKGNEVEQWLKTLPREDKENPLKDLPEPSYINPELPDNSALLSIEAEIEAATTTNAEYDKYVKFTEDVAKKAAKKLELEANKKKHADEVTARIAYINQFDFGFKGLSTNEAGELELNGRPIKDPYFSTGERIMIVAKLMRSRNPVFMTVFLDSFTELDEVNGPKILADLEAEGFQVIVSIPNETEQTGDNTIVLRECQLVTDEVEGEKLI